ncbi:hypothetical protein KKI19_00535 [Patescibacteria group bacterium]|nr:hypothetical protein [Patescibacteria group bacterium]
MLSGWDNLHPEFNFFLNIKRSIFAVWQEYQGLGLLGGMGHASDLPRQLFLWLTSFILPTHLLRYFYHFLMLFIGPLGIYFLLKKIILVRFKENQKEIASFIGAIFYLFNLATLQMFYVPFEPYSTHFAFLPWLFLVNLNFLNRGDKRSFVFLLLVNILAIPQGYVATYFLVYFIFLSIVFLFYFLLKKRAIKRVLVAYLILFCVNAFWLLPNLYFVASDVGVNLSAKINQMSTEKNFLLNKKYGNLANTTILKGFWFDNVEIDKSGKMNYQMGKWVTHLQNPLTLGVGYLLFLLSMCGAFFACKKRIKAAIIFIPAFFFFFVILSNDTYLLSFLASFFYKIPLLFQIFRFPYTKFAIIIAFCLSIFYSITFLSIYTFVKRSILKKGLIIIFILLPIIFLFPFWQGELFYRKNRTEIPNEYFKVFNFFKTQEKNSRIANFPLHTFWGWNFSRWGYSGSGFIWYGIEQPILDRAFDPWSNQNENYYWEISYALYSQNRELFEKILEKYQINWLLVDKNIINPSSPKALYINELEEILLELEKVTLSQEFGKIKIYQVKLETPVNNFVFLAQNLPSVGPDYRWSNYDLAYASNGSYLSQDESKLLDIYYPFRSLFSGRNQSDIEFKVEDKGDYYLFKHEIPESLRDYVLIVPSKENKELVWIDPNDLNEIHYLQPEVKIVEQTVEVKVPKVGGYFSADIIPANLIKDKPVSCNRFAQGEVSNEIIDKKLLRLSSTDANNCSASFWLPNLPHKYAYLIAAESRYVKGKSLLFWLENLNSRRADIETYLPKETEITSSYIIQSPMEEDGLGYTLHFDNVSIGRVESVNDLGKVTVNQIPFNFLIDIKMVRKQTENNQRLLAPLKVQHPNPSFYRIEKEPINNQIFVLSQAFHPGWQAYEGNEKIPTILTPLFGKRIKSHVLVNNWENGWILDNQSKIDIIFLPQYLEYFGFLIFLLFGCFTLIFLVKL